MNLFDRLLDYFRRKPGMIGTPPSGRQVSFDVESYAGAFSRRYFEPMDYLAAHG